MIEISALRHRTLRIERLVIPPGFSAVIGENGCGKTTLLRLISGIELPEHGTVTINGVPPRQAEAGYVHEYPDRNLLFPTVADEIASPLRFRHLPCDATGCRVQETAAAMQICHILERPVRDLSGGEKVLTGIAAALVHRPKLLVLDEYDSHLDPARCREIEAMLRSSGAEFFVQCTQRMETAASGDFVIMLHEGRVVHAGLPLEVFPHLEKTPFYPCSWRQKP